MANILFITIGTRDVQISQEIEKNLEVRSRLNLSAHPDNGCFALASARIEGKKILDKWNDYAPYVELPMIFPAVRWIVDIHDKIDLIYLVPTDQERAKVVVDVKYLNFDTVHFAEIIKRYLTDKFPGQIVKIKSNVVTDNIVFQDLIYEKFRRDIKEDATLKKLDKSDVSALVFTQGGISGINNALLIAVTEIFPRVSHLTKPEGFSEPINSKFPHLFRQNIMVEKIRYAIENFEYGMLSNFNYSNLCNSLSDYAYNRLHFNFKQARKSLAKYDDVEERYFIASCVNETRLIEEDMTLRNKEWYITCKIKLHQKSYADFLLRIFNLAENILKPQVERILGGVIKFSHTDKHREWNELLTNAGLVDHLATVSLDGTPLQFRYPNRYAFKSIFDYKGDSESVLKFSNLIDPGLSKLALLRNSVGHNLHGVSEHDIELELEKAGLSIESFLENLDMYFDIQGFEHFDQINSVLQRHLA